MKSDWLGASKANSFRPKIKEKVPADTLLCNEPGNLYLTPNA